MPVPSCPPEIKAMMTVSVLWEQFIGFDGHAEPSYAPGIELKCFREAHSLIQTGNEALRTATNTTATPDYDLYFACDNSYAQEFSLYDRFTVGGVGVDDAVTQQPFAINTVVGPPFDNRYPWMIVVAVT